MNCILTDLFASKLLSSSYTFSYPKTKLDFHICFEVILDTSNSTKLSMIQLLIPTRWCTIIPYNYYSIRHFWNYRKEQDFSPNLIRPTKTKTKTKKQKNKNKFVKVQTIKPLKVNVKH